MPAYFDIKTRKWYCKFYYTDWTGEKKQKCKRGFDRKSDAKEWERDFLAKTQGTPDMTLGALCANYLEYCRGRRKPLTLIQKESVARVHILPYFGQKAVRDITPADVLAWQNEELNKGLAPSTVKTHNAQLIALFNYGAKIYGLPNPAANLEKIGKSNTSINYWTVAEFNAAMGALEHYPSLVFFTLQFWGGFRLGETLALTPADIDIEHCTISISKQWRYNGRQPAIEGTPKSARGVRVVSMPKTVINMVSEYMQKLHGLKDDSRIFEGLLQQTLGLRLKRAAAAVGVRQIRIHDLRHSHVSMLINNGADIYLVANRIGDTTEMVLKVYGHLYDSRTVELANTLENIISNL